MNARRIVFHADDLGMNPAVDDGIVQCFERGLLTSTSVMANGPTAASGLERVRNLSEAWRQSAFDPAALRLAAGDPRQPLDLGVHLNLTQGRPLTGDRYPAALLDAEGRFPGAGRLFASLLPIGGRMRAAIENEFAAQVAFVFDHGVHPTHLNGHQYIELFPHVRGAVLHVCRRFGIRVVRVALERDLAA
ncbi:MAG TPA: ChbG/HpnK family deacetylase, partial [Pirellulales bacterium]|nr:ChbG/HpnK family deacetylase [Pirellulales bacterium]